MRAPAAVFLGIVVTALGGCSIGGEDEQDRSERSDRTGRSGSDRSGGSDGSPAITVSPKRGEPQEAGPIRSWSAALNRGDYGQAASFFARNAIVEQTQEFRLPGRSAAIAFNKSLPCRADLTDVDDEGHTVLAAFRLRDGPGGRCEGGSARVRFRFKGGRFSEWRQLAQPDQAPGEIA